MKDVRKVVEGKKFKGNKLEKSMFVTDEFRRKLEIKGIRRND